MASRFSRPLLTLALVVIGGGLAFLGRLSLNWFIILAPKWEIEIERFGGAALGMIIGLLVVIPVYRMYGVFDKGKDGARPDTTTDAELEAADTTKK